MRIFGPLVSASTSAVTDAELSADTSEVTASPSTSSNVVRFTLEPIASSRRSTSMMSPTATLCWRPPLRTIAYTPDLLSLVGLIRWCTTHGFEGTPTRAEPCAPRIQGTRPLLTGSNHRQTGRLTRRRRDSARHYGDFDHLDGWRDPGSRQTRRGHPRRLRPGRMGCAIQRRDHGSADG